MFKVILLYIHGNGRRSVNENFYGVIVSQKVSHAATNPVTEQIIRKKYILNCTKTLI
jgi:hypothetical protein